MGISNFKLGKQKNIINNKGNKMTIVYKIKPNDTRIKLFGKNDRK